MTTISPIYLICACVMIACAAYYLYDGEDDAQTGRLACVVVSFSAAVFLVLLSIIL